MGEDGDPYDDDDLENDQDIEDDDLDENDNDDELDEDEDDNPDEIEPTPLLTEIVSVWISVIGIIFTRASSFFEDEIDLASWRRFWIAVISGTIMGDLIPRLATTLSEEHILGQVREARSVLFDLFWMGCIGVIIFAIVLYVAGRFSYREIERQKIPTDADFLEHMHLLAIAWLTRQFFVGLFSFVNTVAGAFILFPRFSALQTPASEAAITLAVWVGILAVLGIIMYWYIVILSRTMKITHEDLVGRSLWIIIGIIFLALDPLRLLLGNVLATAPVVIWLHDQLRIALLGYPQS